MVLVRAGKPVPHINVRRSPIRHPGTRPMGDPSTPHGVITCNVLARHRNNMTQEKLCMLPRAFVLILYYLLVTLYYYYFLALPTVNTHWSFQLKPLLFSIYIQNQLTEFWKWFAFLTGGKAHSEELLYLCNNLPSRLHCAARMLANLMSILCT